MRARVAAKAGERLAVNFDIDNTVIATYYDGGGAIPKMLKFARLLSGRCGAGLQHRPARQPAGAPGSAHRRLHGRRLCLRNKGETLPVGKQRCRDSFIADGYTLIANVGNNDTDFAGDGYERAFGLPNYRGVLGISPGRAAPG